MLLLLARESGTQTLFPRCIALLYLSEEAIKAAVGDAIFKIGKNVCMRNQWLSFDKTTKLYSRKVASTDYPTIPMYDTTLRILLRRVERGGLALQMPPHGRVCS